MQGGKLRRHVASDGALNGRVWLNFRRAAEEALTQGIELLIPYTRQGWRVAANCRARRATDGAELALDAAAQARVPCAKGLELFVRRLHREQAAVERPPARREDENSFAEEYRRGVSPISGCRCTFGRGRPQPACGWAQRLAAGGTDDVAGAQMDDQDCVAGACTARPLSAGFIICCIGRSLRGCRWHGSAAGLGATTAEIPRARGAAERDRCVRLSPVQHAQHRPPGRAAAGAGGLWKRGRHGYAQG